MPPSTLPLNLSRVTLLVLLSLGVYNLQVSSRSNGLFDMMEASIHKNTITDPSTGDTAKLDFTGVKPVDELMGFVLMFFWPIISGEDLRLALSSFAFAGQGVALWGLTLLEAGRNGNKSGWKLVSFPAIYGTIMQLMGAGILSPTYLLLYTLTSPLTKAPTTPAASVSSITQISTLPATLTLSYILPIITMCLPTDKISLETKLRAHNAWQIFPLTCVLTQTILKVIWPFDPPTTPKNTLSALRAAYKFLLAVVVPTHILAWGLAGTTLVFPNLFNAKLVADLHPAAAFVPPRDTFTGLTASSVAEGALWFIQWDYWLSGVAYLVWGIVLRQRATRAVELNLQGRKKGGFGVGEVLRVGVRVVVLGPIGAATVYLWERDETLFAAGVGGGEKKVL